MRRSVGGVAGFFLNLFAGGFGVFTEALHGIATAEEQRAKRQAEHDKSGFVKGIHRNVG